MTFGSILSGTTAYVVIALGTRAVGAEAFAPVSVLWSLWAVTAAAISFPVQHWAIQSAETTGMSSLWRALPRLGMGIAVAATLSTGVALALGVRLFSHSSPSFALMTGLLPLGSAMVGVQRGALAHQRRFSMVAVSLAGENVIRAVVAAGVLVAGTDGTRGATAIGWGIVAGFLVVIVAPGVLRPPPRSPTGGTRASIRLLGGFAGANVSAQAVLTAGPVVLSLLAAEPSTVTELFAVLALLRVPYTGLVGVTAGVTGPLVRLVAGGGEAVLRRLEIGLAVGAMVIGLLASLAAPIVLPPLVELLFATRVAMPTIALAALGAGGVLAVASLLEMLVLLSLRRGGHLVTAWALAILVGTLGLALPFEPVVRVAGAFLIAEITALTLMVLPRGGASPTAGAGDHR